MYVRPDVVSSANAENGIVISAFAAIATPTNAENILLSSNIFHVLLL
jgi:hypothetical protein